MMIHCPHCATSYQVDAASIGETGRQVRCVRCRRVWFATPEAESIPEQQLARQLAAAAADLDPSAPAVDGPDMLPADPAVPALSTDLSTDGETVIAREGASAVQDHARNDGGAEQIDVSPSIVPPIDQLASLPTALPDPDGDAESFTARRECLRTRLQEERRLHMPSAGVCIFVLVLVLGGLLGWRKSVVRHMPQTASLYAAIGLPVNLRGVVFDNIKTSQDMQDGVPVLVVEGMIGSISNLPVDIPRLRFGLRNEAGNEIYSWTAAAPKNQLASGEQVAFRSRLASPPTDAQNVTVRFFTKHDIVAGVR